MLRNLRIRTKVIALSLSAVFLMAVVLVSMVLVRKGPLNHELGTELNQIARDQTARTAQDVWLMCRSAHESMLDRLRAASDGAQQIEHDLGGVAFSGPSLRWEARNQLTQAVVPVELPGALVGDRSLGQNVDPARPSPLVDDIRKVTGTTATLFQRMNAQGDMLRVATNVQGKDGKRAIGTFIPAAGADGAPNAVIAAVMRGETYVGRAFVVDDWYLTAYRPLRDSGGRVDGMMFVGVRQANLEALRKSIMDIDVGTTGYVYVLGGKGAEAGRYIVSHEGKRDGESVWETKDADGNLVIQQIVARGLATADGSIDFQKYPWSNKQGEKPETKIAAVTYFAPWDWVIGAGTYESDFLAAQRRTNASLNSLVAWTGAAALVMLGLCALLALLIGRSIDRDIGAVGAQFGRLSERIAAGDLDSRGEATLVGRDFRGLIGAANEIIDRFVPPVRMTADAVDRIARGEIPEHVDTGAQGEFLAVERNLNRCIDAVNSLIGDANTLSAAAVRGELATRADVTRHQGDFRRIIEGVNATLDAVIQPLNVAAAYVDRISKGDVPGKITDEYLGDFNTIKQNLNRCIDGLGGLLEANSVLQRMSVNDHTCAVTGAYAGVFAEVGGAVNEVRERLLHLTDTANRIAAGDLSDLDGYKAVNNGQGRRSDNDRLVPSFIGMMEGIQGLVNESKGLTDAALAGRLEHRADATRFAGEFRNAVEGMNRILAAVADPIREASTVLETLAAYDLRARMEGQYHGDLAKIKTSLNQTATALHDAMAQVSDASVQVSAAGQQIASSSQQVAEGASEQASSLEETSSTLEEISSMTKRTADHARQTKSLTLATRDAADRGAASMGQMIGAMDKIRKASEATAQIIRDINEIAFQTNLLALNAAVEAARAGDAGRGFAVVAEEVRGLALRAKEAAKRTEDLIRESVDLAKAGEQISNQVGGNLEEILTSVSKVAEIVGEVTEASMEQSRGIEQVNTAVAEMDRVVQQATANAEESSSAAQELAGQAQELAGMVGRFQLSGQEQGRGARGTTAKRPSPSRKPSSLPSPAGRGSGGPAPDPRQLIPLEDDTVLATF